MAVDIEISEDHTQEALELMIQAKDRALEAVGLQGEMYAKMSNTMRQFQCIIQLKAGATPAQARHEARQIGVGILNAYYKRTFKKFGYDYVTRKKDYKYNR